MKRFAIEYYSHEWTLYRYDKELNNLPDIKGKEINQYIDIPNLADYENDRLSINASWGNIEKEGYINLEYKGVYSTYYDEYEFDNFDDFIKELNNIENIIDRFMLNVIDYEYEYEDPYGSRGLSISDFI